MPRGPGLSPGFSPLHHAGPVRMEGGLQMGWTLGWPTPGPLATASRVFLLCSLFLPGFSFFLPHLLSQPWPSNDGVAGQF